MQSYLFATSLSVCLSVCLFVCQTDQFYGFIILESFGLHSRIVLVSAMLVRLSSGYLERRIIDLRLVARELVR